MIYIATCATGALTEVSVTFPVKDPIKEIVSWTNLNLVCDDQL
jgi:hypothetical protein